jgi:YVTN family beta-propeller protein
MSIGTRMNKLLRIMLASLVPVVVPVTVFLSGCENEPVRVTGPDFQGSAGVFIVNEGNFMFDNSSLSFYDYSTNKVYNNIFLVANGIPLGDVAQSLCFSGDKGYVVVNNSAKIICFNPEDAVLAGRITGFESPRHMLIIDDNKAYVSDLYARKIFIVDPVTCAVTGTIDTDKGSGLFYQHSAETMLLHGLRVFAACWSFDNTVLVIDNRTDRVTDSIKVCKQPNSMVIDREGRLWVLSDGGFHGSAYGQDTAALSCIDTESLRVLKKLSFPSLDASPVNLVANARADTLYYINTGIYRMPISSSALPAEPLIGGAGKQFYSLGVDPLSSEVYVGDAIDYQQPGLVYRYRDTELVDSFRTGIIPGEFYFTRNR